MTKQKQKLLKAKIAAALYHENGKVPTPEEIDKWTKFAKVLYTAVLGLHFERQEQKKHGQLAIFGYPRNAGHFLSSMIYRHGCSSLTRPRQFIDLV
jgi:hypothetical protein